MPIVVDAEPGTVGGTGGDPDLGGAGGSSGGIAAPTGFPQLNLFATDFYAFLEPVADQDEALGFPLAVLCGAAGIAMDQVEAVCRVTIPGRAPYQQVYDINECPDERVPGLLGWLGQVVGVPWVAYTDTAAKRLQVQAEANFYRGTIPNIEAAVVATQNAGGRVTVVERDPDAWNLTIGYDSAYTPNPAASEAAALAAVPWGIEVTLVSTSLPTFEEATVTFDSVPSPITFESATLAEVT